MLRSKISLLTILLSFALASCQNYVAGVYQGGSFSFSDKFTFWTSENTISIYNNSQLDASPTNYTHPSSFSYLFPLPNDQILLISSKYQTFDPLSNQITISGTFSPYYLYTFYFGVNSTIFFYNLYYYSTQLYYVNTTTGKSFVLDRNFAWNMWLLYLSPTQILIVNTQDSSFKVRSLLDGTVLYSRQQSDPMMGYGVTKYQVFYLIIRNGIRVFSSASYSLLFKATFNNAEAQRVWMPNASKFLVYTNDGILRIYSLSGSVLGSIYLGTGSLDFTDLNDDLIAVQYANSIVSLYNISATAPNFLYASFSASNLVFNSLRYLESSLFAGLAAGNQVLVFDYNLKTLVRKMTLSQQLSSLVGYVSGSFFIRQYSSSSNYMYLSTCHYSCLECSGLGQNSCSACSSNRILSMTDSTCTCENMTCAADQNPCFTCGDEIETLTDQSNWQTTASSTTSTAVSITSSTMPSTITSSTSTTTTTPSTSTSTISTYPTTTSSTSTSDSISTSEPSTTSEPTTTSTTSTTSTASTTEETPESTETTETTETNSSPTTTTTTSSSSSSKPSRVRSIPPPSTTTTTTPSNANGATTKGTGQTAASIDYLQAVNTGIYATKQTINVYMKAQTAIYYLITVQGTNIADQDSCSYIKQSSSHSSDACYVSMDIPTNYGETGTAYYKSVSNNQNYILNFYGLRGSTTYYVKICGNSDDESDYQTLTFTTRNNNYKVVKFLFELSTSVDPNLTQDFLCYLSYLLTFPSSRLYSLDGTQCNQVLVNLVNSPEIYEKDPSNRRLLAETTSSTSSTTNSSGPSNSVGVIFYGNAYSESSDNSVDKAMTQLSTLRDTSGLMFSDRTGKSVAITTISYQGLLTSDAPVLSNDITIQSTRDSVVLSGLVIENMRGFVYAMITPQVEDQTAPTQTQIKANSNKTRNGTSDSSNKGYYFWYYDGTNPVSVSFSNLTEAQAYTVYYFGSNEDLSSFAKYTSVYSKIIQTGGASKIAGLIVGVVIVTIAIFITLVAGAIICLKKPKRQLKPQHRRVISENPSTSPQITMRPSEAADTHAAKTEKDEPFDRMIIDLDIPSPMSIKNTQRVEDISVEVIEEVKPNPLEDIQQQIEALEKKIGQYEQEKLCPGCQKHPRNVLLGCGHMICSEKCVSLVNCPIDDSPIKSRKRVY